MRTTMSGEPNPDVWASETRKDATQVRAQLRNAAKEWNTDGEVETEPRNWLRKVSFWCD